MIVHGRSRESNQNGRCGDTFLDGSLIRYVEYVGEDVLVTDLGGDELARDNSLRGSRFVPRTISCEVSRFDGQLVVTLFGYHADTGDSAMYVTKPGYFPAT